MTPNELPAAPIKVDDDALTAIDHKTVPGVVNEHYTHARNEVTGARLRHDHHRQETARERDEGDPFAAGEHDAKALKALHDWSAWLGAAAALERLADDLGVKLADDRRAYLPPEGRT